MTHMAEQPVVVQKISWSDLCPWTLIFKTLPVASGVSVLAFALLGIVLSSVGWWLSESIFIGDELRSQEPLMRIVESNHSPYQNLFSHAPLQAGQFDFVGRRFNGPQLIFHQMVDPFRSLFSRQIGLREFFYFLFGCIGSVLVWSFAGLGIVRVCLLRLTRNEHEGLGDAFQFARRKWLTALGTTGVPLISVAALCVPAFFVGLLMLFNIGVLLAGVLWILVLVLATLMGLLLFGLMFGWPLMIASVGCESQNSFDAMTRSYSYTFQRPLHYCFYMLIAMLFGGFCWMIAATLTTHIIDLAAWSTSWGANVISVDRMDIIQGSPRTPIPADIQESGMLTAGQSLIGFWNAVMKTLAAAFIYGLFWCMASAIYLLLRKDVDEMEMDEIFVADETRTFALPPLRSDELGIPQVQDPVPVDEDSNNEESGDSNES